MVWCGDSIRPRRQLEDLLSGKTPYDEATPAIQSMARLQFFLAAQEVLSAATDQEKRARLDKVPPHAKVHVEYEIKRILRYERGSV